MEEISTNGQDCIRTQVCLSSQIEGIDDILRISRFIDFWLKSTTLNKDRQCEEVPKDEARFFLNRKGVSPNP